MNSERSKERIATAIRILDSEGDSDPLICDSDNLLTSPFTPPYPLTIKRVIKGTIKEVNSDRDRDLLVSAIVNPDRDPLHFSDFSPFHPSSLPIFLPSHFLLPSLPILLSNVKIN